MIVEIGTIGALLLLGAWIFETIESVREHKALVDLRFALVYATAQIFLITYSWSIQDYIFLAISGTIFLAVIFEIIFTLYLKRIKKRGRC